MKKIIITAEREARFSPYMRMHAVRTRSMEKCSAVLQSARSPFCVLRFCPIFRARIKCICASLWEFQSKQVFHLSLVFPWVYSLGMRKSLHVNRFKWHVWRFKCTKHKYACAGRAFELGQNRAIQSAARFVILASNYGQ